MAAIIKIKRSGTSGAPGALRNGEFAYSYLNDDAGNINNGGQRLYIGTGTETNGVAANIEVVGGKHFTDMLDHAHGTLTTSSAIITDANSKIDNLKVDNIDINGNTISILDANGTLELIPNGTGAINVPVGYKDRSGFGTNSLTTKEYVDAVAGATEITFNGNTGTDTFDLDDSAFSFVGADGILATINNAAATNTLTFSLTDGAVSIDKLASKNITFGGGTGSSFARNLGTTVTITGGTGITTTADGTSDISVDLDNTAVSAGSYGSASSIPTFTVDAQGRLTAAGSQNVSTTLSVTGDTGSGAINLLDSDLEILGNSASGVTTAVSGKVLTITNSSATSSQKGVATFNTADFDVTAGDVTIKSGGVSNTQLENSTFGITDGGSTASASLGGSLTISAATGLSVSTTGSTVALTGTDATTSAKGVASFASSDFTVTNGAVAVKAGGISNTQLAGNITNAKLVNSSITIEDSEGSQFTASLGGAIKFADGIGTNARVDALNGLVYVDGVDATTSTKGVASFNSNDFAVSSGDVTIKTGGVGADQLETTLDLTGHSVTFNSGEISNGELANSTIEINGTSIALGNSGTINTDAIAAGSNPARQYYDSATTVTTARNAISATDAGGDGSISYNPSTGLITYTGVTDTQIRSKFAAGTGVTYTSGTGTFAIGQAVGTTDSVTFSGANFTSDVVIDGDLTVHGTNTIINTTTLAVSDAMIQVANSNETSDTLDIGFLGHYSDDGGTTKRHTGLVRDATDGVYQLFDNLDQAGLDSTDPDTEINVSAASYQFADLRVGTITADAFVGPSNNFNTQFAQRTTDSLSEGLTNLYYTTARVDSDMGDILTAGTGISITEGAGIITVAGTDAAADGTTKGIATFNATHFSASSGLITANDITLTADDAGTAQATIGEGFTVQGDQNNGAITTSASGTTLTVSAELATASQKGVASFNSTNFAVNTGVVTSNNITFAGETGTLGKTLGGTLNIVGDTTQGTVTEVSGGNLVVKGRNATYTSKGVARFADSDFSVINGFVSIETVDGGTY